VNPKPEGDRDGDGMDEEENATWQEDRKLVC
jgi:hypothetical protein